MNSIIDMLSAVDLMERAGVAATTTRLSGHLKQSFKRSAAQLKELEERGIVVCHVMMYRTNLPSKSYRISHAGENVVVSLEGCNRSELPF